jgi:peptidoglycan/xylan/chitin deacetylase (PgdA/CDA1 family)
LRFKISHTDASAHAYSIDSLYSGVQIQSAVLFTFDDGLISEYTVAYTYMKTRHVRGTLYAVSDWQTGTGGNTSWAQLREMWQNGWTIGNHTKDHTTLTGMAEADQETEINACEAALQANGITTRTKHVASPGGAYDANTMTALAAAGSLTHRQASSTRTTQIPVPNYYLLPGRSLSANTISLATAQGYVDTAKSRGEVAIFYNHALSDSPGASDWYSDRFRSLVDYCIAQNVPIITMDDLCQLQSGPISIPKAV